MSKDYIIRKRSGKKYRITVKEVVTVKLAGQIVGYQVGDRYFDEQEGGAYNRAWRYARGMRTE